VDHFPTASKGQTAAPVEEGLPSLAAKLPVEGITVSGLLGLTGGVLTVVEDNGPGPQDDLRVDFRVPSGALSELTLISMTVSNDAVGDLLMDFAPDGLDFLTEAELDISQGEDLVGLPVEQITAWHEHGDGTVEEAIITFRSHSEQTVRVKVAVPGFSRYGLREH
jgi:hypothetical protein